MDRSNLSIKPWNPLFDAKDELMYNTLVWIKLLGPAMEFGMMQALWAISNHLGKTILVNENLLDEGFR